jgi:hypothetical protein
MRQVVMTEHKYTNFRVLLQNTVKDKSSIFFRLLVMTKLYVLLGDIIFNKLGMLCILHEGKFIDFFINQ